MRMQAWEYMTAVGSYSERAGTWRITRVNGSETHHDQNVRDFLNVQGRQGWELVSCAVDQREHKVQLDDMLGTYMGTHTIVRDYYMILKRPL